MTKRMLAVLASATLVFGIVIWRLSLAATPVPDAPPVAAPSTSRNAPTPAPALPTPRAPAVNDEAPAELRAMLDDARGRLVTAARPCWTGGHADVPVNTPDETLGELAIRYELVSDGAEMHVDALAIQRSTIADLALRACIERAWTAARWASKAPQGRLLLHDTVGVGELTRREPPVVP